MQVNQLTGKARISDVIRSRFSAWKPDKPRAKHACLGIQLWAGQEQQSKSADTSALE